MNTNDSITVKDIFHYAGIFFLSGLLFFGLIYYFEGNIIFSAIGTVIAAIPLAIGLTYLLVKLKTVTQYHSKKRKWEILVLVGYLLLVLIPSGYFISKLITIEFSEKETIQSKALNQVEEISDIFVAYRKHVNDKYNNYNVSLKNNRESNIDGKLHNLEDALLGGEVSRIDQKQKDFVSKSKQTLKSWNRLRVPEVLNETKRKKQKWLTILINESNTHEATNDLGSFNYALKESNNNNLLNPPLKNANWFLVLFVVLIINGLILWPYFFATRDTRPEGNKEPEGLTI